MTGIGTLVNCAAIAAGGVVGLTIGKRFLERYQKIATQAMGLATILVGLQMALQTQNILIVVVAMVAGAVVGEWLDIEAHLERLAVLFSNKMGAKKEGGFCIGFVTATLLYCIGSLAVLGAIQDGIKNDPSILYTKAVLDGVIAVPLGSTLGAGVIFSFLPVALYQGSITVVAAFLGDIASQAAIDNLTSTGGLLILALGLNLLELTKLKAGNMLPALFFAVFISALI